MEALLKGMRDYWQASERGEDHHAPTDASATLEQALLNLQESVTASGAVITHDPLPIVRADESALVQVFQNLIGNAIKYRGDETPQIHISAARNAGGEWMFSVKDDGIGIDAQILVQGRREGHWGLLGMRERAVSLGGRLEVWSERGAGTEVELRVPGKIAFCRPKLRLRLAKQ